MKCNVRVTDRNFQTAIEEDRDLDITDRPALIALGRALKAGNWVARIAVELKYKGVYGSWILYMANDNVEITTPWMEVNGRTMY